MTYIIAEREFEVGKITLRQYKKIHEILKEAGNLPLEVKSEGEVVVAIGVFLNNLIEKNLVEKFLSVVLTEKGKKWNEEDAERNVKIMSEIDDETLVMVIKDFFSGRLRLIQDLIKSFKDSVKLNGLLNQNSEEKLITTNQKK